MTLREYFGIATDHTDSFVFDITCPSSFTEDSFTVGTVTFDLLKDTSKSVGLPTLSGIPSSCYSVTWNFIRASDNQNMLIAKPTVFQMSATDLTISHTVSDFQARLDLFGSESFYF